LVRQISYQKPIDASRSKAGVAISPFLSLRAFCSAEGVAISSLCHCTPAKGESGNLIFFPPFCHCEGSQGSLWQSRLLKRHKNIDCFVASLLAMTAEELSLRRLSVGEPVAISSFKKTQKYRLLRRFAPRNDNERNYHCTPAKGESGNLIFFSSLLSLRGLPREPVAISSFRKTQKYRLLRRFAPRNDNERNYHCTPAKGESGNLIFFSSLLSLRGLPREPVAISSFKKTQKYRLLRRFAPRNDSVVRLASPTQFTNL